MKDLLDLADEIVVAARSDPLLMQVLKDYEQACERMNDTATRPEDQALWAEIRAELAAEIKRLLQNTGTRQKQPHKKIADQSSKRRNDDET